MGWFEDWLARWKRLKAQEAGKPQFAYRLVIDPGRWDRPWKRTLWIRAAGRLEAMDKAHDMLMREWFMSAWLFEAGSNEPIIEFDGTAGKKEGGGNFTSSQLHAGKASSRSCSMSAVEY